jgi:hypothetical protein
VVGFKKQVCLSYWKSLLIYWYIVANLGKFFSRSLPTNWALILFEIACWKAATLAVLFQFSSLIRLKNSKKKLVKSWFHYYKFLSLVTAVYSQLALLYIYSSKKIKILKLIKVPLRKNGFIVYIAFLLKQDIL